MRASVLIGDPASPPAPRRAVPLLERENEGRGQLLSSGAGSVLGGIS